MLVQRGGCGRLVLIQDEELLVLFYWSESTRETLDGWVQSVVDNRSFLWILLMIQTRGVGGRGRPRLVN